MHARRKIIGTGLTAAVALAVVGLSAPGAAQAQEAKMEKCYGIAKAGKNDCQTATNSCAGTSRTDRQGDAFVVVPAGTCDKVSGGSLTPAKKG